MNNTNDGMEEFSFAKLLMMFIHYDLKNHELLEYQVRSYYRLMQKTDRLYKCEKIMLEFFKAVSEIKTRKLRRERLEELQKKIAVIFKTPYERGFSFYFDIRSWIESELTGKEFSVVVRKNSIIGD
jgi:hypothetical protein